jgi:hypothetical protein
MDFLLPETPDISALQAVVNTHNAICRERYKAMSPEFTAPGLLLPENSGLVKATALPPADTEMDAHFAAMIKGTGLPMKKKPLGDPLDAHEEPSTLLPEAPVPGILHMTLDKLTKLPKITGDTLTILMLRDVIAGQKILPAKNGQDEAGLHILIGGIHSDTIADRLEATLARFRKVAAIDIDPATQQQAPGPTRAPRTHHGARFDTTPLDAQGQER